VTPERFTLDPVICCSSPEIKAEIYNFSTLGFLAVSYFLKAEVNVSTSQMILAKSSVSSNGIDAPCPALGNHRGPPQRSMETAADLLYTLI
jgi:hypothetical protein